MCFVFVFLRRRRRRRLALLATFQQTLPMPIEISHKMLSNHQIARYLCGINYIKSKFPVMFQ